MASRWYVDTNILLRFAWPSFGNSSLVEEAVGRLLAEGAQLHFATQGAAEFWNVWTRPPAGNGLGLSPAQADAALAALSKHFTLLFDTELAYRHWRRLVYAHNVRGKQVHDARLVASMLEHGIEQILTLNGSDFQRYPGIRVVGPEEMV